MSSAAKGSREPLIAVVSRLRSQGLDTYIDLPRILLCGNRLSSKNTAVEEATGVRCLLFNMSPQSPTEVILSKSGEPSTTVTIIPSAARSAEQIEKLKLFRRTIDADRRFRSIHNTTEDVKNELEMLPVGENGECDIVRVEIRSPNAQNLSVMDLPSLVPEGTSVDDSSAYKQKMKKVALQHMRNSRNMVLVVLDDAYAENREDILKLAQECDPHGHRTFGLVFLHKKSKDKRFGKMQVSIRSLNCRFGWHIMQHPLFSARSNGPYDRMVSLLSPYGPDHTQLVSLKDCLRGAVEEHAEGELPDIIADIETALFDRRDQIKQIDSPCTPVETQRRLLFDFSMKFTSLVTAAADGIYNDPFFIGAENDAPKNRSTQLRSVVNKLLASTEKELRDSFADRGRRLDLNGGKGPEGVLGPKSLAGHKVEGLDDQIWRHQGRELPGTMSSTVVSALVADTCRPWESILESSVKRIASAVEETTSDIVASAADHQIEQAVSHVTRLALDKLVHELSNKTRELLAPYYSMRPIAFSQHITEAVRRSQHDRTRKCVLKRLEDMMIDFRSPITKAVLNREHLLDEMTSHVEEELWQQPVALAIDYTKAYCQVL